MPRIFMLGNAVDVISAVGTGGDRGFVKIEVTIRLLTRKNGRANVKSSNKNRSTRTIVPGTTGPSLFFHFARRTNQAEGCYQNFRLRDKLNYGGNSDTGGHTGRKLPTGGEKTGRQREG